MHFNDDMNSSRRDFFIVNNDIATQPGCSEHFFEDEDTGFDALRDFLRCASGDCKCGCLRAGLYGG